MSEGVVSVTGERIDWHTQAPFDILTSISSDGIMQSIDGAQPVPLAAGSDGWIGQLTSALTALLRGDIASLKQTFNVGVTEPRGPSGRWMVTLEPVSNALASALGTIEVVGCNLVEQVKLQRPSGDHDLIEMFPMASSPRSGHAAVDDPR